MLVSMAEGCVLYCVYYLKCDLPSGSEMLLTGSRFIRLVVSL